MINRTLVHLLHAGFVSEQPIMPWVASFSIIYIVCSHVMWGAADAYNARIPWTIKSSMLFMFYIINFIITRKPFHFSIFLYDLLYEVIFFKGDIKCYCSTKSEWVVPTGGSRDSLWSYSFFPWLYFECSNERKMVLHHKVQS